MKTILSCILFFLLSAQLAYSQDSLSVSELFRSDGLYSSFRSASMESMMMDSVEQIERKKHADSLQLITDRIIWEKSDLDSVLSLIEKKGIPGAVADSSRFTRFLLWKNDKIYLTIYHDIFRYRPIVESYPKVYNLINKGVIVITTRRHTYGTGLVSGIDLPPLSFTSTGQIDYKQLAADYLNYINSLLPNNNCNPNVLKYYLAQESYKDSWKDISIKRKFFIEFIKKGCR